MNYVLRHEVLFVLSRLLKAGYQAYLVGGAVRDLFLKFDNVDFDFTTNATPEEIQALFPESYYQNEFGTVSITHQELLKQMSVTIDRAELVIQETATTDRLIDLARAKKIHQSIEVSSALKEHFADEQTSWQFFPDFEITTYRSGEVYSDFRKPDPKQLNWGKTIEEDLERRDFSINAMALSFPLAVLEKLDLTKGMETNFNEDQVKLVDPFNGQNDLANQLIRTVGDADDRFTEDALRLLRAIRFSVQLDFRLEEETWLALKRHADLLEHISAERISKEFFQILTSPKPALGIRRLEATGLLKFILPELLETHQVEQGGHHTTDVWTHALNSLAACPSHDPIVRLASLIHDIGKPQTYEVRDGQITFYNHEIVSSRIADKVAKRLKLSKRNRERLFTLVRHHMFYYQPDHTDAAIRRFIKRVGLENIDDILAVREADRLGSGARKTSWRLEEMKERIVAQLNQPMEVTDLAINGHDLMQEFDKQPGPWLGETLDHLLELVLEKPEINQKKQLINQAQQFLAKTN